MVRKGRSTTIALAVLAIALIALSLPALAAAASQTFVVNVIGDTATKANCETATGECTLRGAIEAANATTETDTIHFDHTEFDGEGGISTIVLGEALPTITEPVEIDAGECTPAHFGVEGPCAEVDGSGLTAENDFTVAADLSSIRGIAINGGKNGIALGSGTELFFATNDWFGVQLGGGIGGASGNAGVLIESGAKNAVIGGETVAERNVFDESPVGVEIRGASENQVQGNFIGLNPEGVFRHSLDVGVRIVDSTAPASKAEFNEIGGARNEGAESEECSGACNAFATEGGPSIELESATGPTTVSGNYIGLSPDGAAATESRSVDGILATPSGIGKPGPGEVTIGGSTAATEANFFAAGECEFGVNAEAAEDLVVLGNEFDYTSDHQKIETGRFEQAAISVSSEGLPEGALIESNSIDAEGSVGIESFFAGSEIVGNDIVGGEPGILASADTEGIGN